MAMSHPVISAVAVYCGASTGNDPAFPQAAAAFGTQLAREELTLIFGGGHVGLMGVVSDAVLAAGGTAIGVMPKTLIDKELAHDGLTRLEVVENMAQRKARMEELADAYVVLPGGIGTLEELFQVFTNQVLQPGVGPIAFLNTGGYWDDLLVAIDTMVAKGFLASKFREALIVTEDPAELIAQLRSWTSPGTRWEN